MNKISPEPLDSLQFKIIEKFFFCCEKLKTIQLELIDNELNFYYNIKKKKLYKKVPCKLVLAINRRLRNEKDKNKLSIYYLEDEKSNVIKELKLKCDNIIDMENCIKQLNSIIKPKKHEFNEFSKNYIKSNEMFHFENKKDFYIALCNIEYIYCKKNMEYFFEYYRKKKKVDNILIDRDDKELIKNDSINTNIII